MPCSVNATISRLVVKTPLLLKASKSLRKYLRSSTNWHTIVLLYHWACKQIRTLLDRPLLLQLLCTIALSPHRHLPGFTAIGFLPSVTYTDGCGASLSLPLTGNFMIRFLRQSLILLLHHIRGSMHVRRGWRSYLPNRPLLWLTIHQHLYFSKSSCIHHCGVMLRTLVYLPIWNSPNYRSCRKRARTN